MQGARQQGKPSHRAEAPTSREQSSTQRATSQNQVPTQGNAEVLVKTLNNITSKAVIVIITLTTLIILLVIYTLWTQISNHRQQIQQNQDQNTNLEYFSNDIRKQLYQNQSSSSIIIKEINTMNSNMGKIEFVDVYYSERDEIYDIIRIFSQTYSLLTSNIISPEIHSLKSSICILLHNIDKKLNINNKKYEELKLLSSKKDEAIKNLFAYQALDLEKDRHKLNDLMAEVDAFQLMPPIVQAYHKCVVRIVQTLDGLMAHAKLDEVGQRAVAILDLATLHERFEGLQQHFIPTQVQQRLQKAVAPGQQPGRETPTESEKTERQGHALWAWIDPVHWQYWSQLLRAEALTEAYLCPIWPEQTAIKRLSVELAYGVHSLRDFLSLLSIQPALIVLGQTRYTKHGKFPMQGEKSESLTILNHDEIRRHVFDGNSASDLTDVIVDVDQWGYISDTNSDIKKVTIVYYTEDLRRKHSIQSAHHAMPPKTMPPRHAKTMNEMSLTSSSRGYTGIRSISHILTSALSGSNWIIA